MSLFPTYVRVQVGKGRQHHLAAQVNLPCPAVCSRLACRVQRRHHAILDLWVGATQW